MRYCTIVVLLLAMVRLSFAAQPLTLSSAFQMAMDHPAVQLRRGGVEAAQEDVNAAAWKRFPTFSGERDQYVSGPSNALTNPPNNGMSVRVQQPIWTGGKITSEIEGAGARKESAGWALVETEQDILTRVAQAYGDLWRLQERMRLAGDNLSEHRLLFERIRRRTDQEISSEADVALAQARLQQAQTELLTFTAAASNARNTLEQLVGMPVATVQQPPVGAGLQWKDPGELLNVVLRFSPTLKRLEEERNAALKDVDSKRAVLYPNVSVRYEKLSGALSVIPIDHWMVVLDYVPGAGLSSFSAIGAAVKRAEMAGNAMVAGQRDVTERTFNQYSDARSFIDQLEPARAYAKASADVMASYLRQYTTGRKSWLDVMNAQREQTQARYAELDAFAGGVLAVLKLEILAGRVTRATVQAEPTKLP